MLQKRSRRARSTQVHRRAGPRADTRGAHALLVARHPQVGESARRARVVPARDPLRRGAGARHALPPRAEPRRAPPRLETGESIAGRVQHAPHLGLWARDHSNADRVVAARPAGQEGRESRGARRAARETAILPPRHARDVDPETAAATPRRRCRCNAPQPRRRRRRDAAAAAATPPRRRRRHAAAAAATPPRRRDAGPASTTSST